MSFLGTVIMGNLELYMLFNVFLNILSMKFKGNLFNEKYSLRKLSSAEKEDLDEHKLNAL